MSWSSNAERWAAHCDVADDVPLFCKAWWLDCVCGTGDWDVAIVDEGGEIKAALPFRLHRPKKVLHLAMPLYTPYLGPYLRIAKVKYDEVLGETHELLEKCIVQLPSNASTDLRLFPEFLDGLPFLWHGYSVLTSWTYRVDLSLFEEEAHWLKMSGRARTEIRKAANSSRLTVTAASPDVLLEQYKKTWARQGLSLPCPEDFFYRLCNVCFEHDAAMAIKACDPAGNTHAAIFCVWDNQSAYYLIGGADPELRSSGATSLLIWEAIKYFKAEGLSFFDFEGSSIKPIEAFFRTFGAVQTLCLRVQKVNSRKVRAARALKQLAGCLAK